MRSVKTYVYALKIKSKLIKNVLVEFKVFYLKKESATELEVGETTVNQDLGKIKY